MLKITKCKFLNIEIESRIKYPGSITMEVKMKKVLFLGIVLAFYGAGLAVNNQNDVEFPVVKESEPIWKGLERLTLAEKENAVIEIELSGDAPLEAIEHSKLVENKWNSGDYDGAIELFRGFTDLYDAAYGIQWKEPITTSAKWGDDVQIGTRDSIYVVTLDVDNTTGNLFSTLLHPEGTVYRWSVNISQDTGKTWSETYTWSSGGYYINDISAVVLGDRFYVGYVSWSEQTNAQIRRFDTDSGYVDATYGFQVVFNYGVEIEDIALTSNADYYDNRIYYSAILADDSLRFYWDDTTATSWSAADPGIGNAPRGLDACCNKAMSVSTDIFFFASYINTDDSLAVLGLNYNGVWIDFGALDYVGSGLWCVSSIGAYRDTVMTVFNHYDGAYYRTRYRVSYNAGNDWAWGWISSSDTTSNKSNITARGGDGFGVVYWEWYDGHQHGKYRWRDYPLSTWSTPVEYADYEPRLIVKPAIERVASGVYGIVYADWPLQNAYFDRSDWVVGITEAPVVKPAILASLNHYPEPFTQYTDIRYQLPARTRVSVKVYDIAGRLVKTLLDGENGPGSYAVRWDGKDKNGRKVPSGVYFYRLNTGNFAESKKMTLLK